MSLRQKDRLDLQQACATARAQEQEAVIAQMSAEAKVGTLEERVQESEQNVCNYSPWSLFDRAVDVTCTSGSLIRIMFLDGYWPL